MKNLDLTKWLQIVRDALAEQDEGKRNTMLHAADRLLKGSNQLSSAFRRTQIGEGGSGKSPGQFIQSKQVDSPRARIYLSRRKQLLGREELFDERPRT